MAPSLDAKGVTMASKEANSFPKLGNVRDCTFSFLYVFVFFCSSSYDGSRKLELKITVFHNLIL